MYQTLLFNRVNPKPLVSVIIPIYKTEKYLPLCLNSIIINLKNTDNIELILIDDCSPGDTAQIIEKYSNYFKNLILVRKLKNEGLFSARITGFKLAVGAYCFTIDSDDEIGFLDFHTLFKELERETYDIYSLNVKSGDSPISSREFLPHSFNENFAYLSHDELWSYFKQVKDWHVFGRFYKKSVVNKIIDFYKDSTPYINNAEDFLIYTLIASSSCTHKYNKDIGFYFYRTNNISLTRNGWENDKRKVLLTLEQFNKVYNETISKLTSLTKSNKEVNDVKNIWSKVLYYHGKDFFPLVGKNNMSIFNKIENTFPKDSIATELVNNYPEILLVVLQNLKRSLQFKPVSNIAFFLHLASGGGAEKSTKNLAKTLQKNGFKIVIITEDPSRNSEEIEDGLRIVNFVGKKRLPLVYDFLRKNQMDTLIFVAHWRENTFREMLWAKYLGFNVIAQEHSNYWFPFYNNIPQLFNVRNSVYKLIDGLTCLSENDKEIWKSSGIRNVFYIPNIAYFDIKKSEGFNKKQILFVGRISRLKGALLLPEILHLVVSRIPEAKLIICGKFEDEELKENFYEKLANYQLLNKVVVNGYNENLSKLYLTSSCLLLPSYIEGSPMVIGEARAAGLPVVCSNLPLDNVDHGVIKVQEFSCEEFANKIVLLFSNEHLWRRLSKDGQIGLSRWGENNVLREWKSLFDSISQVTDQQITCSSINIEGFLQGIDYSCKTYHKNIIDDVILKKVRRYDKIDKKLTTFFPIGSTRRKILKKIVTLISTKQ